MKNLYLSAVLFLWSAVVAFGQNYNTWHGSGVQNKGYYNTSIGYYAGNGIDNSAYYNVFLGANSGRSLLAGDANVLIGYNAGRLLKLSNNTFVGNESGYSTSGIGNTYIGSGSGRNNSGGNYNSPIAQVFSTCANNQTRNEPEPISTKYKYHDPEGTYFILIAQGFSTCANNQTRMNRAHEHKI